MEIPLHLVFHAFKTAEPTSIIFGTLQCHFVVVTEYSYII